MEISSRPTPGCFNSASFASSSSLKCFKSICSIADYPWLEDTQAPEGAGFNEPSLFLQRCPVGIGVVDYLSAQSRTAFGLTHSLWFRAITKPYTNEYPPLELTMVY